MQTIPIKANVKLALGKYPAISLAQARAKNIEIKTLLAQGIDPKEHTKQAVQIDTCFDVFAQKWLEHHETRTKPHTFKRDKGAYHNHIFPVIGNKDIYTLRLPDIMAVHDRLAVAGKTSTAHRVIG